MLAEIIRNNIIFVMNRRDKYVENDPRNIALFLYHMKRTLNTIRPVKVEIS